MPPLSRTTAFLPRITLWLGRLGSFHRITLFVPADDTLVENFHVPVTVFIENAIGQTGQVMRTCSIEHKRSVAWNAFQIAFEFAERCRDCAENMNFAIFLLGAHIDDQRLRTRV